MPAVISFSRALRNTGEFFRSCRIIIQEYKNHQYLKLCYHNHRWQYNKYSRAIRFTGTAAACMFLIYFIILAPIIVFLLLPCMSEINLTRNTGHHEIFCTRRDTRVNDSTLLRVGPAKPGCYKRSLLSFVSKPFSVVTKWTATDCLNRAN